MFLALVTETVLPHRGNEDQQERTTRTTRREPQELRERHIQFRRTEYPIRSPSACSWINIYVLQDIDRIFIRKMCSVPVLARSYCCKIPTLASGHCGESSRRASSRARLETCSPIRKVHFLTPRTVGRTCRPDSCEHQLFRSRRRIVASY